MKKFYQQIVPIFIITAILPMIGTFCYPLIDSDPLMPEILITESNVVVLDACQSELMLVTANAPLLSASSSANHHNKTLLPCCQEGGRADVANLSGLQRIDRTVAAILFINPDLNILNTGSVIYKAPDISPPELIALQTTVLRL